MNRILIRIGIVVLVYLTEIALIHIFIYSNNDLLKAISFIITAVIVTFGLVSYNNALQAAHKKFKNDEMPNTYTFFAPLSIVSIILLFPFKIWHEDLL